jgi:hypothetical protein
MTRCTPTASASIKLDHAQYVPNRPELCPANLPLPSSAGMTWAAGGLDSQSASRGRVAVGSQTSATLPRAARGWGAKGLGVDRFVDRVAG